MNSICGKGLIGASVLALGAAGFANAAAAGGFAVREQSASYQGTSFAGSAAGLDLSSMYWNPAAVTTKKGMNNEAHAAAILGSQNFNADFSLVPGASLNSGNVASPAFLTASYLNYQVNDQLYVGLSLNAPFGLTTKPDGVWAGSPLGFTSRLLSFNAAPTVGYKINDSLSVAAGVQIQYLQATRLTSGPTAAGDVVIDGDDIGFGYTLGVLYKPSAWTTIGLGFRSSISHTLEGDQSSSLGGGSIEASADLPELVTFSFAQNVTQQFKILGTVEWTNWSRVTEIPIECTQTGAGTGLCGAGGNVGALEFNYDDGWFFSLGAEYQMTPKTLLRAGYAYEISPARSDSSRTVRLADNDRHWFSAGVAQQLTETISLDLGYSFILVEDGGIEQSIPTGGTFTASFTDAHVNVITAAVKVKMH
ncbi:MAG: OmpP1/FadL family transporter [Pseudomonadota bacterium]